MSYNKADRQVNEMRKTIYEQMFNKELETIQKRDQIEILELNDTITKLNNWIEKFSSRLDQVGKKHQ